MERRTFTRIILCSALVLCLVFTQVSGTDAKTWYTRGDDFNQKGDYPGAIDAYRNAVTMDPGYIEAWLSLGYVYVKSGRNGDAVDAYQHALSIEPDNTQALEGIGYVNTRLGKNKEALAAFNHAINVTPADPTLWLQKGLTLSALGNLNESIPVYMKVLQLSPGDFDAYNCMGLDYYTLGNYTAALDAFTHAASIDERSAIAWKYKGQSLYHLGRYQEAIEAFNRGLIVSPGNADLLSDKDAAESALRSYIGGSGTPSTPAGQPLPIQFLLVILIAVVVLAVICVFFIRRRKASRQVGNKGSENVRVEPPVAGPDSPGGAGESTGTVPHDIFISYSSRDKAIADATCAYLESRGIRCWIAPRDILPGSNYPRSIVEAIDGSYVMVLVFSSNSNSSPHVVRELTHAVSKGVIILPFRIEDIQPSKDIEYLIGIPHWLDAMTPPLERHLAHLAETVEILIRNSKKAREK
jgi:Flp pilus assembly protein TadD